MWATTHQQQLHEKRLFNESSLRMSTKHQPAYHQTRPHNYHNAVYIATRTRLGCYGVLVCFFSLTFSLRISFSSAKLYFVPYLHLTNLLLLLWRNVSLFILCNTKTVCDDRFFFIPPRWKSRSCVKKELCVDSNFFLSLLLFALCFFQKHSF